LEASTLGGAETAQPSSEGVLILKPQLLGTPSSDAVTHNLEVYHVKKFLVLLALVVGVTAIPAMKATGSSPASKAAVAADRREARACEVLLRKMSQSPSADTWRNRMRAWPCIRRAKVTHAFMVEARR